MADFETDPEEKRRKKKRKLRGSEGDERCSKAIRLNLSETKEQPPEENVQEQVEVNDNLKPGAPWRNLDLILSLQNKELDLQRKVEIAFDFVKWTKLSGETDVMNRSVETVSSSRLIAFLTGWIQSLLISPDKKIMVEGKKPRSGTMEACLDVRCWEIFKFCLEGAATPVIPLRFSPNLFRAFSCVAVDALSILNSQELSFHGEGFELYRLVPDCLSLLFSSHEVVINANMDQWASIVAEVLVLVQKVYSVEVTVENSLHFLLHFSYLVLEPFANFLRVYPTPKNIFPAFVDSLLEKLLVLLVDMRITTEDSKSVWTGKLLKLVEDILSDGLFHPTHIDGFLSTRGAEKYTDSGKKEGKDFKVVLKSYHRHLFKKLESIISQKKVSSLDSVGDLFRLFVIRVKKQKGVPVLSDQTATLEKAKISEKLVNGNANSLTMASTMESNSMSINSSSSRLDPGTSKSIFDLFVQFVEPLLLDLKSYAETDLERGTILWDAHCTLKSTNKIIAGFMHEKIYIRTEDTFNGACLNFLKEIHGTILSFSSRILLTWASYLKTDDRRNIEALPLVAKDIIISLGYFLEIEYQVVGDDLVSLWLIVFIYSTVGMSALSSPGGCSLTSEIRHFGSQLISVYSDLRQVNTPIFALCKAIRLFGFCDEDSELDYSKLLSIRSSLSSEICMKSVLVLLCSQEFRLTISSAIKSIPEGQASGCIRHLIMDVLESLEWMKANTRRDCAEEFGGLHLQLCNISYLILPAELLGRAVSEVYSLILDNCVVTMGNSVLMGNSTRDLLMAICPSLSSLIGKQQGSVNEFLFSVTGMRLYNHTYVGANNGLLTVRSIASWIFLFFFRLYTSCRSLYRQSIGLMPPGLSRKMSAAMGDLFTAYSGKDWMEGLDWKDEGYFSWITRPSHSLLTIIKFVSDTCFQETPVECAPLNYVLHVMALQRLVDLNRQIKAFEFVHERAIRQLEVKSEINADLPINHKKNKCKKLITVFEQEAADITDFLMGYLPVVVDNIPSIYNGDNVASKCKEAQTGLDDDAWDLGICSVTEKLLPTAVWWILCQNADIWCSHATKKKLKKFLSYLYMSYSFYMSCAKGIGDHRSDTNQKVTMCRISIELLSNTAFYEQKCFYRCLTSAFCHVLKKLVLSLFCDSSSIDVDFNSLEDLPSTLRKLDDMSLNLNEWSHDELSEIGQDCLPFDSSTDDSMELKASQSLLNLLCWMPKNYIKSKYISICASYILNLERLVILNIFDYRGKMKGQRWYELFRLFVCCRRALKCMVIAYCEEKVEVRQSSPILILLKSSYSILWLSKSISKVLPLFQALSDKQTIPVRYLMFSLMDHTSYLFLTLSKTQFSFALQSLVHDGNSQFESPLLKRVRGDDANDSTNFEHSETFDDWKSLVLLVEPLKEQMLGLLVTLKSDLCGEELETGGSSISLNKVSSVVSCFQGFLWGLLSVLNDVNQVRTGDTKPLREGLIFDSNLNLCVSVFEKFVNSYLYTLLLQDSFQPLNLCDKQILPNADSQNKNFCGESHEFSVHRLEYKTAMSSTKLEENFSGRTDDLVINPDAVLQNEKYSEMNDVKCSSTLKKKVQLGCKDFDTNIMTEAESFAKELKKPFLRDLLKGKNPDVAFLVRQLFIASSAILRLKLYVRHHTFSSCSMAFLIGTSQFLLSELAEMVKEPHPFSFVWLDGVLKYVEVLGSYISLTNPALSRDLYANLIDVHLRVIGRCITLQGKGATLASHETESSTKTLDGEIGLLKSTVSYEPYSLDEFKARLRISFNVFIRKAFELHLLTAVQSLERALVGVQDGCRMNYEIITGGEGGGKISSIVAAGVDCFDLLLESVSGRKHLNVLKRHIQNLNSALFNIVLHLQGPLIFYRKSASCGSEVDPDPGSVILMCVEVLAKVAGKSLFEMDSSHVGQALRMPGALFQHFHKLRSYHTPSNASRPFSDQDSRALGGSLFNVVDSQFSVDLYAACCRLLSTVIRHHKSESQQSISLLEESVTILIHCLEAVDNDSVRVKGYFAWDILEGIKCASFLRRIYEEIRQQKVDGLLCSYFLSNYIWIYSGYGPLGTGIRREIDEALRPGIYALIDACSSDDLQRLHIILGEGPCRRTLATLQHDYKLNFQYEGKV